MEVTSDSFCCLINSSWFIFFALVITSFYLYRIYYLLLDWNSLLIELTMFCYPYFGEFIVFVLGVEIYSENSLKHMKSDQ